MGRHPYKRYLLQRGFAKGPRDRRECVSSGKDLKTQARLSLGALERLALQIRQLDSQSWYASNKPLEKNRHGGKNGLVPPNHQERKPMPWVKNNKDARVVIPHEKKENSSACLPPKGSRQNLSESGSNSPNLSGHDQDGLFLSQTSVHEILGQQHPP